MSSGVIFTPRYLKPSAVVVIVGLPLSSSLRNSNTDLELLILYPKSSNNSVRFEMLFFKSVRKICHLQIKKLSGLIALTAVAKAAIANVKSSGEEGHPCLVDLCKLKGFDMMS